MESQETILTTSTASVSTDLSLTTVAATTTVFITTTSTTTLSTLIAALKTLLLGSIIICAVVGNALVILSVSRYHNLRTKANTFIVSLAFADLLVALLVMPFSASQEVAERWLFNGLTCDLFNANDVLFSTASLLNLCCISLDRFIAITDPFNYSTKLNKCKVVVLLTTAWVASILVSHLPIHLKLYSTDAFAHSPLFHSFSQHTSESDANTSSSLYTNNHFVTAQGFKNNPNVYNSFRKNCFNNVSLSESQSNNNYKLLDDSKSTSNLNLNHLQFLSFHNPCHDDGLEIVDANFYNVVNAHVDNKDVYIVQFDGNNLQNEVLQNTDKNGDPQTLNNNMNFDNIMEHGICSFQVNWLYGIVSSIISFWIPTFVMLFTYRKIFNEAKRQVDQIEKLRPSKSLPSPNVLSTEMVSLKSKMSPHDKGITSSTRSINSRTDSYQSIVVSNENLKIKTTTKLPHNDNNGKYKSNNKCLKPPSEAIANDNDARTTNKTLNNCSNTPHKITSHSNTHHQSNSNLSVSSNYLTVDQISNKNNKLIIKTSKTTTNNNDDQDFQKTPLHKRSFTNLLTAFQAELKNQAAATLQQQTNNENRRRIKREHKAAKTLGIIMGVFLGCWLPFFIWYLTDSICQERCNTPKFVVSLLFWVGYTNSALNPLIYAYFNREFRGAFRKQLCQCKRVFSWGRVKRPHVMTEVGVSCSEKHNNWSAEASSNNKKEDV